MTSISQLYETFSKNVPATELPVTKKDEFIRNIKKLDEKGNEILFILIKLHELQTSDSLDIPYQGKLICNELKFDMENIPPQLQHILSKFVVAHIKRMEEDAKINQDRESMITSH